MCSILPPSSFLFIVFYCNIYSFTDRETEREREREREERERERLTKTDRQRETEKANIPKIRYPASKTDRSIQNTDIQMYGHTDR